MRSHNDHDSGYRVARHRQLCERASDPATVIARALQARGPRGFGQPEDQRPSQIADSIFI
jgi:hypothetical protein